MRTASASARLLKPFSSLNHPTVPLATRPSLLPRVFLPERTSYTRRRACLTSGAHTNFHEKALFVKPTWRLLVVER
jgi:hypothetical protein